MNKPSGISRFRRDFFAVLSFFVSLFLVISIGPGAFPALAAQVNLAWNANTDSSVIGYKLYYGTASRTYNAPVDVGSKTQYTLTNIVEGKTAYFAVTAYDSSRTESGFSQELKCVTLTPSAGANGAISPSSAVVVSSDMTQTFTITPAANYKVSDVRVDGVSVGAKTSYTFSNVTANRTISASFIATSATYIAPAGLLKLDFEEGSGSTAKDSSGSGNNGAISNAVYTTDRARGSYALSFAGNGRVSVPANSSLKPANISVGFWVKHTTDTSTSYRGIIQGAYGNGYSKGFRVLDYQNKPMVQINFGDAAPVAVSGKAFVLNQWTHVAFSYDHQKIKLYQNGVLTGELSATRNINWDATASNLTIGLAQWYFKGLIDRVQLFDRALSSQEIGQLYVATRFASDSSVTSSPVFSEQTRDKLFSSARTTHSSLASAKKGSETQKARKQKITRVESHLLAGSGMLPGSGGWIKVFNPGGEEAAPSVYIDLPEYNALSCQRRPENVSYSAV
ncbi:MAG: LamG-like jellyroll fold domain-containing protein [Desulfatirhabdiaceae bacterium]